MARPCPYKKCDNSGLIPFKKEGRVIAHAWTHCDCHPQYGLNPQEHYWEPRPGDFDYPMSSDFRGYSYQYCGIQDPGYRQPQPDVTGIEERVDNLEAISAEPGQVPRQYHYHLQQLQSQVAHLQNKINGHLDKSKGGDNSAF